MDAPCLLELLSSEACDALFQGLAALQNRSEESEHLEFDYQAKLLYYLAFISDKLKEWAVYPTGRALPWKFGFISNGNHKRQLSQAVATAEVGSGILPLITFCSQHGLLSRSTKGQDPKGHLVRTKYLSFSQDQVRQLEQQPQALRWAILEKVTLHFLDRVSSSMFKRHFEQQVPQLVRAVAGVSPRPHRDPPAAAGMSFQEQAAEAKDFVKGANKLTSWANKLGKLAKAGTVAASGAQVYGGAAIMSGAASAGSTGVGAAIASVTGVSASCAGVAAGAVAPAVIAYTAVSAVLPDDAAGNAARVAAAATGTTAVLGTAAGLGAAMSAGVTAASGAICTGGSALTVVLGQIGSLVGGGMAAGTTVLAVAPAAALVVAGAGVFGLVRLCTSEGNQGARPADIPPHVRLEQLLKPFGPALPCNVVGVLCAAGVTPEQLPEVGSGVVERLFRGDVELQLHLICAINYLKVKATL